MADNTKVLVGVGLLGGAAYFYFNPRAFTSMLQALGLSPQQAEDLTHSAGLQVPRPQPVPSGVGAIGLATGGAAAGGNAAGGIGAGVGAAVGLIAWGIMDQGWFRGGWEGVKGNTIRDKFLDQFVQTYFPGGGVEMQYEAMVKALESVGIVGDDGYPGSSNPSAGHLIRQIYSADRHDEMRQAFASWAAVFAAKGMRIAIPPESEY